MHTCLGIETSCDETAASVVSGHTDVRSNTVSSQYIHAQYGGVVPELAARAHMRLIMPVTTAALESAQRDLHDISLVAVTYTPGLMGALLVGLPFAKALAYGLGVPFVGVNHLEGHLFALRLEYPDLEPPFLSAILSGGHTELIVVEEWCRYRHLGSTLDDAIGEAFDKVAKLLGLPYPGGAVVESLARSGSASLGFPVPDPGGLDFSFSGLKTALLYAVEGPGMKGPRLELTEKVKCDLAASFEQAACDILVGKLLRAAKRRGLRTVSVAGGVAANRKLRAMLAERAAAEGMKAAVAPTELCTDNAAMVAALGYHQLARGDGKGADRLALSIAPELERPVRRKK